MPKNSIWDVGNGFKWIYLSDIKINNYYFYFRICFENNRLHRVEFSFYHQALPKKRSWDDWTEQEDLQQIKMYDKYLISIMGTNNKTFDWGTVSSFYDRKSCVTGIGIKYK